MGTTFFAAEVLLYLWIVWWGGARWLRHTRAMGYLLDPVAPEWTEDGMKVFASLALLATLVWGGVGLL